ncbi:HpcH/HpaI aldolase/citrate lyase family protein [Arthrobacter sp. B2a2-09]|uniref:HpcH/HpaI aldolase/citrate lyase family protein n=1 Tax=Arthrobacter sp. B2a2-09 TaxID=2952822 RepID=UPI0022CD2711|nr:CoA ester lyase [Arthrobacter sp. B2a2-09]MCZ9882565.1 CoA ester lyase [Arthrobacter sp. B2a2-09]
MTSARSILSVPGSSQRFLDKAANSAADVVMVDWEDGVAHGDKAAARGLTNGFLQTSARRVWVRVNASLTEQFAHDAAAANQWTERSVPLVLPMSTLASAALAARSIAGAPLIAMIETPEGVEQAADIARLPRVVGLMFGEYDFLATMAGTGASRMTHTGWAKSRIINAAAATGKWAIAGPNADFSDPESLRQQAAQEAGLGFAGKLCIHPSQIDTVNEAFGPAPEYVSWARDLLEEITERNHDGAFRFRGQMIDAPVIERARTAVRLAGAVR